MDTIVITQPAPLAFKDIRLYIFSSLFITGNLLFPAVLHFLGGNLGMIFLPIYFFSIVAGLKFGWRCGLLTALASPLASFLLSGMPPISILPVVVFKSISLVVISSLLMGKERFKNVFLVSFVTVFATQILVSMSVIFIYHNSVMAFSDILVGWPGLMSQIIIAPFIVNSDKWIKNL